MICKQLQSIGCKTPLDIQNHHRDVGRVLVPGDDTNIDYFNDCFHMYINVADQGADEVFSKKVLSVALQDTVNVAML
eukprot:6083793-Karenia_brevis.AAC.1